VKILNRVLAAQGEAVCVCDFEAMLGPKQPTVSYDRGTQEEHDPAEPSQMRKTSQLLFGTKSL
jgi:hypothetical protein